MSLPDIAQYALFLLIVLILVKPVGGYLTRVFAGEKTWLDPALRPVERFIYRLTRIDPQRQMNSKQYTIAFVLFSLVGTLLLYVILRLQTFLPWYDPVHMTTPMTPDLAMNTAISFSTTTTWQAYGGETTMSYFSQIVGLAVQNFLAGAAGLAIGMAFIRGSPDSILRTWETSGWMWCVPCFGCSCRYRSWEASCSSGKGSR